MINLDDMNFMSPHSESMDDRIVEELAFQIKKGFPNVGNTRIPDSESPFLFYSLFPDEIQTHAVKVVRAGDEYQFVYLNNAGRGGTAAVMLSYISGWLDSVLPVRSGNSHAWKALSLKLNTLIQNVFPPGRFLSSYMGSFNVKTRILTVSYAGCNTYYILDRKQHIKKKQFSGESPPFGLMPSEMLPPYPVSRLRIPAGVKVILNNNDLWSGGRDFPESGELQEFPFESMNEAMISKGEISISSVYPDLKIDFKESQSEDSVQTMMGLDSLFYARLKNADSIHLPRVLYEELSTVVMEPHLSESHSDDGSGWIHDYDNSCLVIG